MSLFTYNKDYLSKNNTLSLKGLLAISVFLCHLPSYLNLFPDSVLGSLIACMGSPSVGMFFFLSGYGLSLSYKNREGYLLKFWHRRILPYTINYALVLTLYIALNLLIFKNIESPLLLKSFVLGGYMLNGWYIQVQFWLYVIFFCVYRLATSIKVKDCLILLTIIGYYIIGIYLNIQSTYYISVILFWVGLIWANNSESIDGLFDKHRKASLIFAVFTLILGAMIIVFRRADIGNGVVSSLLTTLSDILICIGAITLIRYIRISFSLTNWLGRYSYEIYVLQGLTFIVFTKIISFNVYINGLLSFILTVILSIVFHTIFDYINSRFKNS